jgi:hypothetical protein
VDPVHHGHGQPLLLLLLRRRFRPVLHQVLLVLLHNAKLCLNGHEWAKRQAAKAGIGFTALDNGFAAIDDPAAVQAICDQLSPEKIDALLRKWLAIPAAPVHPRRLRRRQPLRDLHRPGRVSLTEVLDRPQTGRIL